MMKLEEAIKEQENALADKWCPWSPKLKASIKLGIEALKRFQQWRECGDDLNISILPGETED